MISGVAEPESRLEETANRLDSFPVLFAAPGGGLGHLVRACAVSVELAKLGLRSRIVTHSIYARGLRQATGCTIDFIPGLQWKRAVRRYVDHAKPRLVVLDTFPWGIRAEWADSAPMPCRFVLLARRLNVPAYLEAAGLQWNAGSPFLRHAIVCEPLSRAYRKLLDASGSELHVLPGRIRLTPDDDSSRVSPRMMEMLRKKPTWLVVHSGPREEVQRLVELAGSDMAEQGDGQIVAVLPREEDYPGVFSFQFFPASILYPHVHRVVTGAGYNCIAETGPWRRKHLSRAFVRRYDEQEERLRGVYQEPISSPENGARCAARYIASLL